MRGRCGSATALGEGWVTARAATGAEVLVRVKNHRRLPVCWALADGSFVSRIGRVEVRVITAQVTITTSDTRRTETYRLVTSVLDPGVPALEIVALSHERWEICTPPAINSPPPPG